MFFPFQKQSYGPAQGLETHIQHLALPWSLSMALVESCNKILFTPPKENTNSSLPDQIIVVIKDIHVALGGS